MKHLIFFFSFLFLISCSDKVSFKKFCQVENAIYDNPNFAKVMVDSLQKTCDSTDEKEMMYLRYLCFLLDDKSYVTHKNIQAIQEMVDFFEKTKDKKNARTSLLCSW